MTAPVFLVPAVLLLQPAVPAADPAPPDSPDDPTAAVRVDGAFFETIDEVRLAAERPGVLKEVAVREGDRVARDAVVARLWDDVPRAQLATAELQAADTISEEYARKAAAVSEAELESSRAANRRVANVIPAAEINRARLSLEQARAQVQKARQDRLVAESQAKELRVTLRTYLTVAPFPGVVQRVLKRAGEAVGQGDPILQLVNTDRLRVVANVPFRDAVRLRSGDRVEGRTVGSDGVPLPGVPPFVGRITFVDTASVDRTGSSNTRVYVEVDNADGRYLAGMRADAALYPGTAPPAERPDREDGGSAGGRDGNDDTPVLSPDVTARPGAAVRAAAAGPTAAG